MAQWGLTEANRLKQKGEYWDLWRFFSATWTSLSYCTHDQSLATRGIVHLQFTLTLEL